MKSKRERLIALRTGQNAPENSGNYWTKEELEQLRNSFFSGEDISEFALEHGRSETSVYQQLAKMGLLKEQCQPRARRSPLRCADCLCRNCPVENCRNRREAYIDAGTV